MNKRQFLKVLKLAHVEYERRMESQGEAYMCHCIDKVHLKGKITMWERGQAVNKILIMIYPHGSLLSYLRTKGSVTSTLHDPNRYYIAANWWKKYITRLELEVEVKSQKS